MPSSPPNNASVATCQNGGVSPHRKSAGMVKIVPVASDELLYVLSTGGRLAALRIR